MDFCLFLTTKKLQFHHIATASSFSENHPSRLSLKQLNLNSKQLEKDSNVMGHFQYECPMSLAAYSMVRCFASTIPSCLSAAPKNSPGQLYEAILTQLNQIVCYVIGAWLCFTSKPYIPSFPHWLSCAMQVVMFFSVQRCHIHFVTMIILPRFTSLEGGVWLNCFIFRCR